MGQCRPVLPELGYGLAQSVMACCWGAHICPQITMETRNVKHVEKIKHLLSHPESWVCVEIVNYLVTFLLSGMADLTHPVL